MCAEAILQCRIDKVVFGAYDLVSGALGSRFNLFEQGRLYSPPKVIGGVLEDECRDLLKQFFRRKKHLENS